MDINVNDFISIVEYKSMNGNFSIFQRGYPFTESSIVNVGIVEFENGVEQRVDRWGRVKKKFDITFPVMKKAEVLQIRDYYDSNIGKQFDFTSPIDNVTYTVRFIENTFSFERSHFDTYFASVSLLEVF